MVNKGKEIDFIFVDMRLSEGLFFDFFLCEGENRVLNLSLFKILFNLSLVLFRVGKNMLILGKKEF